MKLRFKYVLMIATAFASLTKPAKSQIIKSDDDSVRTNSYLTESVDHRALRAVATSSPLKIDGRVEESAWLAAPRADSFLQYEPHLGQASTVKTEALVLFDSQHLYIAFLAWDAEAATAQLTRRDENLFNDDAVMVILDTHHDRRLILKRVLG